MKSLRLLMPRPDQKHHYVPVFYLKQWGGPDGRVCEYSRPHKRVVPRLVHPDGTGYVRGLYSIEGLPLETMNVIETELLKPTDGMAADALKSLVEGREFVRPAQMRASWCRFILSMMLRFPEALAETKRQLRENVQKAYEQNRKEGEPERFEDYEELHKTGELQRLHGKLLLDLLQDSRMGRLLFGMHWGVMDFSRYDHTLLTSDRPVASNIFAISANHVCLPIGPAKMFFACETESAELEFRRLDPGHVMRISNDGNATRAAKYTYGRDDRQLRFVENRLGRALKPKAWFWSMRTRWTARHSGRSG